MATSLFEGMASALSELAAVRPLGRVARATGGVVHLSGLSARAGLGDRVSFGHGAESLPAEVIRVGPDGIDVLVEGLAEGVLVGDPVSLAPRRNFAPDDGWIGRVIDPDGRPLDGRPLLPGSSPRRIRAAPPAAQARRSLGKRIATGYAVFDTLLPLVRGQRIGLFAGSGVGKSTLLANLARGVGADVIVIGLVGERGREVRHFVEEVLGPDGMARSVVIAATSEKSPQLRRRCAWAATTVAEHFRDEGKQVLLLLDSVTRFAEAHREIAASAGEATALRGFPASTVPAIAALCERAGPGAEEAGDITAVYSVLVAGSDMEEPVADMLRGVLDGHVVLDREIAEKGRFPAIDLLRSVSRALPAAATDTENTLIGEARALLGTYDRAEMMIQAGLYAAGSDPSIDAAIASRDALDGFLASRSPNGIEAAFGALRRAVSTSRAGERTAQRRARPVKQGSAARQTGAE